MSENKLIVGSFEVECHDSVEYYAVQGDTRTECLQSDDTLKALSKAVLNYLQKEMANSGRVCNGYRLDAVPGDVCGFALYSEYDKDCVKSALAFCDRNIAAE